MFDSCDADCRTSADLTGEGCPGAPSAFARDGLSQERIDMHLAASAISVDGELVTALDQPAPPRPG